MSITRKLISIEFIEAFRFRYHSFFCGLTKLFIKLGLTKKVDWRGINITLIVSTGRTGTHFFAHFFNNNFKNTFAVHEPKVDLHDLNVRYIEGNVSEEKCLQLIDYHRRKINRYLRKNNITNYVESNNNLSGMIRLLDKHVNKLKVVHIVRDGKATVASMYDQTTKSRLHGPSKFMADGDTRKRFSALSLRNDPYHNQWKMMTRFEKICWYWSRKDAQIINEIKGMDNAISFHFEDLFVNKNPGEWKKLLDFCGLEPNFKNKEELNAYIDERRSNFKDIKTLGDFGNWPEDYQSVFKKVAGEHMKASGYHI